MKFLDHLNNIDEIINKINEENHQKTLFGISQNELSGLGFTTVSTSSIGTLTSVRYSGDIGNGSFFMQSGPNGTFTIL